MPYHARAVRGTVVVAKGRKHVLARVTREHVRPFSERSARHSALPFTSQWVQVTRAARERRPRLRLRARWVGDVWAAPWRGSARIGGFFHPFGEGLQLVCSHPIWCSLVRLRAGEKKSQGVRDVGSWWHPPRPARRQPRVVRPLKVIGATRFRRSLKMKVRYCVGHTLHLRARGVGGGWGTPGANIPQTFRIFAPVREPLQAVPEDMRIKPLVQRRSIHGGVVKFERCAGCCLLVCPTSASTTAASQRACTESEKA